MFHRHLNHQRFTIAAFDELISRGRWQAWAELHRVVSSSRTLLNKVEHVRHHYAQSLHFWMHVASANICNRFSINSLSFSRLVFQQHES